MKQIIYILLMIILISCGSSPIEKNEKQVHSKENESRSRGNTSISFDSSNKVGVNEDDFATYYVIVTDTSLDYFILQKKMIDLNKKWNIPIDTMGRFYNKTKNLITLSDDDKDEIYAGDYFPRRFPSNNLSLEYLSFYQSLASNKTIALVAGIYESEERADSLMSVLSKAEKNVFKIKAHMYVGCVH